MRHELTIDKIPLLNYGVWFDGAEVFNGGTPDINSVAIPGKNGNLIFDNKRFNNVTVSYAALMNQKFFQRFLDFRSFLYSNRGYRRIEDSHLPNIYRMGRITGDINPSHIAWNDNAAMFSLVFDCRPELYLKAGEQTLTVLSEEIPYGGTPMEDIVFNPTRFNAKPLIRAYLTREGVGRIRVNKELVSIDVGREEIPYVDLDCDLQEAYYKNMNCNRYVTIEKYDFPVLKPGDNILQKNGNISYVEITPRWWTL